MVKHVPKTVKKKVCVSTKAHDHGGYGSPHEIHVHDDHGGYGDDHGGYGDDHGGYGKDDHKDHGG